MRAVGKRAGTNTELAKEICTKQLTGLAGIAAERVHTALGLPEGSLLLDVACGTGLVTERLVRPGLQVFAVDTALAPGDVVTILAAVSGG